MAKTRTMAEIAKDYKVCKKYVDEHPSLTSLKEVAQALGLTESQVETSLSRHPRVLNGIKKQINNNQDALKANKKAQKEAEKEAKYKAKQEALEAKMRDEAKRKAEQEALEAKMRDEAKRKAEQEALEAKMRNEAKRKAEQEALETKMRNRNTSEIKKSKFVGFVIDASITGIDGIMDILNKICTTNNKIILTSVTIKELEKMQKFHDADGNDARRILAMAAGNYSHFECVLIDETVGSPDDCIIKYCSDNKDKIVLMTSDKTMELKARTYGIKTHFFKQSKNAPVTTTRTAGDTRLNSLYDAKKCGNKLCITDFGNEFKSICVISDGIVYNNGIVDLKIGDDVYIATKKIGYVTFAHYKIVSLSAENNCKLTYYKRLYDLAKVNDLPEAGYKSFMREFKHKVTL